MDFVHKWIPDQVRDDSVGVDTPYNKQLFILNNGCYKKYTLSAVIPDLIRDPHMGVAHTIKWTKSIQDTTKE